MSTITTIAALNAHLDNVEADARNTIAKFAAEIGASKNPAADLRWADSAFRAAARLAVVGEIRAHVESLVKHGDVTISYVAAHGCAAADLDAAVIYEVARVASKEVMRAATQQRRDGASGSIDYETTRAWADAFAAIGARW